MNKKQSIQVWIAGGITLCCLAVTSPTQAQITSDRTTPSNVTQAGNIFEITGGTTAGKNLFHSFNEFSVPNGDVASFINNNAAIENVINRVTGSSDSKIFGRLKADGSAPYFNLFLLNPNGVVFGPNASLDINGSFVATTANAIGLANGDIFSANPGEPLPTELLNVNPNAFLFNQLATRSIVNRSTENSIGLKVPQSQSLLLVGGDIQLDGGRLRAPGGRVELAGVAGSGAVGLSVDNSNLHLSFPDSVARADVSLTKGAEVNVRAGGGGSIAINTRNLEILAGSQLQGGIASGLGSAESQAGDITINATGTTTVDGGSTVNTDVGESSDLEKDKQKAMGDGGNILITTGLLEVKNGILAADTYGIGDAGSVNIRASDTVSFDGVGSRAASEVGEGATGKGGSVNIETGSLFVTNGASLSASTDGIGNAGDVNIKARDTVSFDGAKSRAASAVEGDGNGKGGSILIETGSLEVKNEAELIATTNGIGNAGSIKIDAREAVTFEAGSAVASVGRVGNRGAEGQGGSITIKTGSLKVIKGADLNTRTNGSGNAGDVTIIARNVSFDGAEGESTGVFSNVSEKAVGKDGGTIKGGNINITAGSLFLENGAELTASSSNRNGTAGNIDVEASSSIQLDNEAAIKSDTIGGEGNIFLRSENLVLRQRSNITTNAQGTATGGNITINTGVLAALENSDISANADEASGGRVIINAQGIFRTPGSEITAASKLGPEFSGTVEINTPDVDPNQGLVTLPEEVVDASGLIAQGCPAEGGTAGKGRSEFVVTGRGGLPPTPRETVSSDTILEDWGKLALASARSPRERMLREYSRQQEHLENPSSGSTAFTYPTPPQPSPLVEAQGWVTSANGEVVLTAQAPTVTPHNPWLKPANCHG